jgi:hypothetical protein
MDWGKSIALFLGVFILLIVGLSFYLMSRPSDDYDPDYYQKGLNFEKDYIREQQVFIDGVAPRFAQKNNMLNIQFKTSCVGKIKFIRPSSGKLDTNFLINTGLGTRWSLNGDFLAKGNWQMILEWTKNRRSYLVHQEIYWH